MKTEEEQLDYLNQELGTNYYSLYEVEWDDISKNTILSEDFIREFRYEFDEVGWGYISIYQKLSEDFIREFKDDVDWCFISQYQQLSDEFKEEFKHKMIFENTDECKIGYEPNEGTTTFDNFRNITLSEEVTSLLKKKKQKNNNKDVFILHKIDKSTLYMR